MASMTNAIAKPEENRLEVLINKDSVKKRFDEVLGKKAALFISSVISATKSNDKLAEAEPMSVISSALVAASLDLPINSNLGFAHIVPYGKSAQFQMGWKGFVQLAVRSGQYHKLNPFVVYEGQLVKWDKFKDEMEFRDEKTSDKVWGYVLYFRLTSGFEKYFVMTADEMEKHAKRYSQAYKSGFGPWKTDFDAMGLKTVTKLGLSKFGVLSIEMNKAVSLDEGVIDPETEEAKFVDVIQEERPTEAQPTSKRLKQAVAAGEPTPTEAATKSKLSAQLLLTAISDFEDADELTAFWATISEEKKTEETKAAFGTKWNALKKKA